MQERKRKAWAFCNTDGRPKKRKAPRKSSTGKLPKVTPLKGGSSKLSQSLSENEQIADINCSHKGQYSEVPQYPVATSSYERSIPSSKFEQMGQPTQGSEKFRESSTGKLPKVTPLKGGSSKLSQSLSENEQIADINCSHGGQYSKVPLYQVATSSYERSIPSSKFEQMGQPTQGSEKFREADVNCSHKGQYSKVPQYPVATSSYERSIPSSKFEQMGQPTQGSEKFRKSVTNSSESPTEKFMKSAFTERKKFQKDSIIFGSVSLPVYNDKAKHFNPYSGIDLDVKEQALLDNLWHLPTSQSVLSFKIQVLNALCFHLFENRKSSIPRKFQSEFSHYVIVRGVKIGLFHKWVTVLNFIKCPSPKWQGFYNFNDAFIFARENLGLDFYIEPPEDVKSYSRTIQEKPGDIFSSQAEEVKEFQTQVAQLKSKNFKEVKSFTDIAKEQPSGEIKSQQDLIRNLEEQIDFHQNDFQKQQLSESLQIKHLSEELSYKEQTIVKMKKVIQKLNKQIEELKLPVSEVIPERSLQSFKAQILDLPWDEAWVPVLDQIPDLNQVIPTEALTNFSKYIISLQKEILDMSFFGIYPENRFEFSKEKYKGVRVKQRSITQTSCYVKNDDGRSVPGVHGLLQLHIDLNKTDLPDEKILQFYHNGMIDFLEFEPTEKTKELVNKFGEKFLLTAGNIATLSPKEKVFCKIFATLPEASETSYRPARKRIVLSEDDKYLREYAIYDPFDYGSIEAEDKIKKFQLSKYLPEFDWEHYKLLAEGHYVQIWSSKNWSMFLPFCGEGDSLQHDHHILNSEES